jgi:hypothetical protein
MGFQGAARDPVVPAFLTWGDPVTDPAYAQGQLGFDAVLSEHHDLTAEVTDYAVEQGVAVVDHVRPNPDRITLETFVTNTPVYSVDAQDQQPLTLDLPYPDQAPAGPGPLGNLFGGGFQAVSSALSRPTQASASVMLFDGDIDYVQNALLQLQSLKDTATLLTIITPRNTYFNMILERIAMQRDRTTGTSGANFSLEFRQIRIVSSSVVAAPLPTIPRAIPTANKGKKDPTAAPQPKQSVAAHQWGNSIGPSAQGFPAPAP